MIISEISIKRSVLASVISLLILLLGIAAYFSLPVRQYPDITRPVVTVTTSYTGASPYTVETSITTPLEESLNVIEGIQYMTSQSYFGGSAITIRFFASRDLDAAVQDVSNAVNSAIERLPDSPQVGRPVITKAGATAEPIIWLVLQGEAYSLEKLSEIADVVVKRRIETLPGVGRAIIGGERPWAMRIWLDSQKMANLGVTADDVALTLSRNNVQLPAGQVESESLFFNVVADAQMPSPEGYADLVIRQEQGAKIRIRDVAWVELGSENYSSLARFNSRPAVGVGVVPQAKSNAIEISNAVRAVLPAVRAALPSGVDLIVAMDTTDYIRDSIDEVTFTLFIAFGLVAVVVLLFLRTLRATVIPLLAIPISVIGAFAGMWALGFSVNVLTLFSLVLAIGLVIDDAIVMLENIYRRLESGEPLAIAAINGSREVGLPIIATTMALIAILVPLALMRGNVGRLFNEFSIVVAIAVALSSLVALTLTPMLCARFLRLTPSRGMLAYAERFIGAMGRGYEHGARWSVQHRKTIGAFLLINILVMGGLYLILPKTFLPVEDQGFFLTVLRAPEGSNLWYTRHYLQQVEKTVDAMPAVEQYFSAIGISIGGPASPRSGILFARLKPFAERDISQMQVVGELFPKLMQLPGVLAFAINPSSLGQATEQEVEFVVQGQSLEELARINEALINEAQQLPGLVNVQSDLTTATPQLDVAFLRERAADLGIAIVDVAQALQIGLGGSDVSDFTVNNKLYDVIVQLDPRYRSRPDEIERIYVRNKNNALTPLSYLVSIENHYGPDTIFHYNLRRSFTVTASLLPFLPLSDALDALQESANRLIPSGYSTALSGQSLEFRETGASLYITFGVSLLFIYLVLAAQFESWIHPLTILLSVPLALAGGLATLLLTGHSINLFSQIGFILLIGLVTKNGILLVEYANQARARGMALVDAAVNAGKIRFRPILMTSLTMVVGTLPLALATGAGAQSRQPLGWVVVGGLFFSTVFTLFVTPVFYIIVTRIADRFGIKTIPPRIVLVGEEGTRGA